MSDDPWIIRLIGGVEGMRRFPELRALIGGYVTRYEPESAASGDQWLWVTDDPEQALAFDDSAELHRFYRQSVGVRPWDGKPNRPITMFHIEAAKRSVFKGASDAA